MIAVDNIYLGDCRELIKNIENDSIDVILSDIPYGISIDDWDILHDNKNSSLLGSSPAQLEAGKVFSKRGKPLNGWSAADKLIPLQYYDWVKSWVDDWYRVLKPGSSVFVFAGRRLAHRCICAFEDTGFIYKDMLGWNKIKAAHRAQHVSCVFDRRNDTKSSLQWKDWKVGNLSPVFEPILWFMKPYKIGSTFADNVLEFQLGAFNEVVLQKYNQKSDNLFNIESLASDRGLHPTQKPLNLMKLLIELTTIENQTILDPFAGSSTTLIAAQQLNRHFIGFECSENFYEISVKRLEQIQNAPVQQKII